MKLKTLLFTYAAICWTLCPLPASKVSACELLAFSFNQEVPAQQLFAAFRHRGAENPDGWGVAFYSDRSVTLFKEPGNAAESKLAEFLTSYPALKARLLIGHVRKARVGEPIHENTHPFVRELNGKEYALVHNGTLKDFQGKLKLSRSRPLGINDTEHLLCYLLGRIDAQGISEWSAPSLQWLHKELQFANDTGLLNCIFTDGTYLFAYHDKNGFKSLYYLPRRAPYGQVEFPDLGQKIDLSTVYPESAVGVVIATKPLTDEKWVRFTPGQFLVFKDGLQVFSEAAVGDKGVSEK
jgi:predicted glutamine amidotransferase